MGDTEEGVTRGGVALPMVVVVVWMCAEKFAFVARAKHKLGKLMCGDQVVPGGRVLWHHIFFEF